jgi:hypothetical protein
VDALTQEPIVETYSIPVKFPRISSRHLPPKSVLVAVDLSMGTDAGLDDHMRILGMDAATKETSQ